MTTTLTNRLVVSPEQRKAMESGLKDAVKALAACPSGGSRAGRVKFTVEYTVDRGEAFTKSVPMAACPWTLLAVALQQAGFGRERLRAMVDQVMAMSAEERESTREGVGSKTKEIMAEIGAKTQQTVQGVQTFSHLVVEVE